MTFPYCTETLPVSPPLRVATSLSASWLELACEHVNTTRSCLITCPIKVLTGSYMTVHVSACSSHGRGVDCGTYLCGLQVWVQVWSCSSTCHENGGVYMYNKASLIDYPGFCLHYFNLQSCKKFSDM